MTKLTFLEFRISFGTFIIVLKLKSTHVKVFWILLIRVTKVKYNNGTCRYQIKEKKSSMYNLSNCGATDTENRLHFYYSKLLRYKHQNLTLLFTGHIKVILSISWDNTTSYTMCWNVKITVFQHLEILKHICL